MPVHERNGGHEVHEVVLACGGDADTPDRVSGMRVIALPPRPGKADVDPVLFDQEATHLVVAGTDTDLAAVVLRLQRTQRLATTSVGFVPAHADSAVADVWRLPTEPARALRLAARGDVDAVPLLRDDAGGVLVGRGVVRPTRGVAYCDDERVLRGQARSITVQPDEAGGPGLLVRVARGVLSNRPVTSTGRAFQLGCVPTAPISDGVAHPRAVTRWTWYRHTEDLRLARGLP